MDVSTAAAQLKMPLGTAYVQMVLGLIIVVCPCGTHSITMQYLFIAS